MDLFSNFISGITKHNMAKVVTRRLDEKDKPRLKSTLYKVNHRGPFPSHEKRTKQFLNATFSPYCFTKVRPEWLRNPKTKRKLELDCYCPELGVAFECDGELHSRFSKHFHKTEKRWKIQQERDRIKDFLCRRQGVKLIRVPFWLHMDSLEDFLLMEMQKNLDVNKI